jgi:hypothetical protein
LFTLACCAPVASPSPPVSWRVPAGWKAETFAFPIEFAPSIAHRGVEELRFAPGMFDPKAPGYWSYAFIWRTDDAAELGADALSQELTAYFRGLAVAVAKDHTADPNAIELHATARAGSFALAGHMLDVFTTGAPVTLEGSASRLACGSHAVWTIVLTPPGSSLRGALDALGGEVRCGQPVAVVRKQ